MDKTDLVWRIAHFSPSVFLSRPRRFGKYLPYVEGFKKKLEDAATAEGFYEYTLYLIFTSLNDLVRTQVKCSSGRTDMVIFMPNAIYVMEFKVNGTAQQALQQINECGYAEPYQSDGRPVFKVGLHFDVHTRTLDSWEVEEPRWGTIRIV